MNNNAAINQLLREMLLLASFQQRKTRAAAAPTCKPSAKVKAAFKAVRQGDHAAATSLIRTPAAANYRLPDRGWCLLDEAVKAGSVAMVQLLLSRGANPNTLFLNDQPFAPVSPYPDGLYFSPFATAINEGKLDIFELLLRHGASLDLPYWGHQNGAPHTCLDLAMDSEFWPQLEASMLAVEVAAKSGSSSVSKRL